MDEIAAWLDARRRAGLFRERRVLGSAQCVEPVVDGRPCLAFCANDYLGLANHPEVIEAMREAASRYGVGSGASHLINGHHLEHEALESELAEFTGRPRALLFSTGYMANLGVVSALSARGQTVCADKLSHASLLDAATLSAATLKRYAHNDLQSLATRLDAHPDTALVIADGVFSMDGDLAPLPALLRMAREHDTRVLIDDAHGFGVLGARGGGVVEHFAITPGAELVCVGTLGKAFGTSGAFVAADGDVIERLIQSARSYIYTTAMPPAVAAATRVSLHLLRTESWRREKLAGLIAHFRAGARRLNLRLMDTHTPIQPLLVGAADKALALTDFLWRRGLLIQAIRPPTVPRGSARLRITLSAAHETTHIDALLDALRAAGETGLLA